MIRKRLIGALLSAAVVAAVPGAAVAAPALPVYLRERPLILPHPTVLAEGRLLVPLRGFVEAMGGHVQWAPPGQITASLGERTMALTVGSAEARVGDRGVTLDVPARLIDSRTYIPVRFFSEGLGAAVHYDGSSVRVVPPQPPRLVVTDGPLNVRSLPSTGAPILTAAPAGTRLVVMQESSGWAQVRLPGGGAGWVTMQYTGVAPPLLSLAPLAPALAGETGYLELQGRCLGLTPLVDGKLYLPLWPVVQRLGGQLSWDGAAVTIRYGTRSARLALDGSVAVVDGLITAMDGAPLLIGGEVLVPARSLAQWLGLQLTWDGDRRTASLRAPGPSVPGEACNPALTAAAYLVMDADTGLVLSERGAAQPRPIASTTKIMTAVLALEQGRLEQMVTVSARAAATEGTRMELRSWQQAPMRDLLYGLILRSGNDAAVAIAEHLAGSEPAFATRMTMRAAELGARDTRFFNASGLDDWVAPFSTARDLAVITRHALQDTTFRSLAGAREFWAGSRRLITRNDFVLNYPGATGVKNGWTEKAGHTLVASAYRDGAELIVVVLGAPTRAALYQTAGALMDRGFVLYRQSWLLQEVR